MDIQLVVASGSKAGQSIAITGSKFIIGRADDCHLKPRSELISRYHCAIISEDGYAAIRDLGSKNGVYLNGERVSLESELKNGDRLSVGPLDFVVNLSVNVKAAKRSKVDSVQEVVARTVEIGSAQQTVEEHSEIADWLYSGDEASDIHDMETRTVAVNSQKEKMDYSPDAEEEIPSQETEKKPKADTGKLPNNQAASSRDAAANLLKNFFKGGR